MPVVQNSYFHLLRPLKGSDTFVVDKAGMPAMLLFEKSGKRDKVQNACVQYLKGNRIY